jgi:hypothetical protein
VQLCGLRPPIIPQTQRAQRVRGLLPFAIPSCPCYVIQVFDLRPHLCSGTREALWCKTLLRRAPQRMSLRLFCWARAAMPASAVQPMSE